MMRLTPIYAAACLTFLLPACADALADTAWDACLKAPTRQCVFDEALIEAASLKDPAKHSYALARIAYSQALLGRSNEARANVEEALRAAPDIANHFSKDRALDAIATAFTTIGDYGRAEEIARSIAGTDRALALAKSAFARAKAGQKAEAARVLLSLVPEAEALDGLERVEALDNVAQAQSQASFSDSATATFDLSLEYARKISEDWRQQEALQENAVARAQVGQIAAASQVSELIADKDFREIALEAIAEAQAQSGAISDAGLIAIRLTSDHQRMGAFKAIALVQAKAGHGDAAATNFGLARLLARSARVASFRAENLATLAKAEASAGLNDAAAADFAAAAEQAQAAEGQNDSQGGNPFEAYSLGRLQIKIGRYSEALSVAVTLPPDQGRDDLLLTVVDAQTDSAKFTDALQTAALVVDEGLRVSAIVSVATKLPN